MRTLLIDSSFIAYQAMYTMDSLTNNDMPSGVIFGFLNRILAIGTKFKSNDLVFCFDSKKSFRRDVYPEYKQKRKENLSEDDKQKRQIMQRQIELLRTEILPLIGFRNNIMVDGLESDDIMAKLAISSINPVILVTSDADMFQCLYPHVSIYNPSKQIMFTMKDFYDKYGFPFWKWPWAKSYMGCSTDNVEGINGIGEKTIADFFNGKLKPGSKKLELLISDEAKEIYKRNWPLVSLPHKNTPELSLVGNKFSKKGFVQVCESYGINSFLEERMYEWKAFFTSKEQTNPVESKIRERMKVL